MLSISKKEWSLIIDTNQYSGNFERELCGYVCGQTDEYGDVRAGEFIELYNKECPDDPFCELITEQINDDGPGPFALAETPGRRNNGMGECFDSNEDLNGVNMFQAYESVEIFFSHKPTVEELERLVARSFAFEKLKQTKKINKNIKIIRCRLVVTVCTTQDEEVFDSI